MGLHWQILDVRGAVLVGLIMMGPKAVSSEQTQKAMRTTCCSDGYGLNYTLPTRPCREVEVNGSMVQTIPKLIPPSPFQQDTCMRTSRLGIPPGHRICRVPDCISNPCKNGWCEETIYNFTCHCSPGFKGLHCDQVITDCSHKPCLNDGECTNEDEMVHCSCIGNWTGRYCEDINDCASNPCVNGSCVDSLNNFTCTCEPGWTGRLCDIEWKCMPNKSKCFHAAPSSMNQSDAKNYCRSLGPVSLHQAMRNVSLLFPSNENEASFLRNEVVTPDWRHTWINCNDIEIEGEYVCEADAEGTTSNYTNWRKSQPNGDSHSDEDCVIIFNHGNANDNKWSDYNCNELYHVICQVIP